MLCMQYSCPPPFENPGYALYQGVSMCPCPLIPCCLQSCIIFLDMLNYIHNHNLLKFISYSHTLSVGFNMIRLSMTACTFVVTKSMFVDLSFRLVFFNCFFAFVYSSIMVLMWKLCQMLCPGWKMSVPWICQAQVHILI